MRALLVLALLATREPAAAPAAPEAAAGAAPAAPEAAAVAAPAARAFPDRLALADRLFLAGDFRNALFAYQDAVYLEPGDARARVRLGRAYEAMRYPDRAIAQYQKALALDPGSLEARRALEALGVLTGTPAHGDAGAPRTDRPAPAAVAIPAAPVGPPAPTPAVAVAPAAPPDAPSPAQRYRAALDLMARRDFARAVAELDDAIAQDPRLAVAYVARASAQFGLAKYREAADDYKAALGLDPSMATPIYGLAECQRLLGDAGAADLYARYAESRAPDVREDLRALAKRRTAE
ncbi:MAG TPA: tetratricopeptide repeat protein, partial [Anaeromyxobacteraceae bacterium]|nr:tetratricopeptide repeat protein [Anaeromyxobacteraceae bacterium]